MTPPKPKDFKKIQKEWYAKAKASGYEDIEEDSHGEQRLKKYVANYLWLKHRPDRYALQANYYRAAGHFLYDHKFKNELEKKIWTLHAEGVSVRIIAERLSKEHYKISKWRAHTTIQRLTKIMISTLRSDNE